MICLLLIMTMIFNNGIAIAEPKFKNLGTGLSEEEINAKTKAWLLMVESGKVDEEEFRRITPKSIFIAPLLTGQEGKCKDGYRYDHLGQCVKVIKIDPKVQLELLLKRLNMLYSEKKEEEEESVSGVSNGPLHFSIPISNADENEGVKKDESTQAVEVQQKNSSTSKVQNLQEFIPVPLPVILLNQTNKTNNAFLASSEHAQVKKINETKDTESSGMGPLNDTEPYATAQFEGSGVASVDVSQDQDFTSTANLMSEEMDYFDMAETEWTTDIPAITETIVEESTTTDAPLESSGSAESYQSIINTPSINKSVPGQSNETLESVEESRNKSKSDIIHFPNDEEEKERIPLRSHLDSGRIRFPDDSSQIHPSPPKLSPSPHWDSQNPIPPSARQQFWWLPENWEVDENHKKSTLVKFWSRMPLVHDISYSEEKKHNFNEPSSSNQPNPQVFNSLTSRNHEFIVTFNHQSSPNRIGKPFRNNRFQDIVSAPRQSFRIQR